MGRENLLSLFADFVRYSNDVAIVQRRGYRREVWTYQKLAQAAMKCAQILSEYDIQTGDRVFLWGPSSTEWMAAFWGSLLRGAVAVPVDDGATIEFARKVSSGAGVKFAFVARDKKSLIPDIPSFVLEDLSDTKSRSSAQNISARDIQDFSSKPIQRSNIAQILYTSGTTGEPRGVVLTHGNFLANLDPLEKGIDPYRKYERWFHPLRFVCLVPLSHVFGQFMTLFVPPLLGATVVFEPSANPAEIVRTIKQEKATALIAVPRMLDALRDFLFREFASRHNESWLSHKLVAAKQRKFLQRAWIFRKLHRKFGWKFWAFISGGAALREDTEDFFKRAGFAVVQGYGLTETASLISLNHPFRATEGSVGKILPGREFKLAQDGEILVRGENVASGYWQKETGATSVLSDISQPAAEQSWLHTGDIGELDSLGNLKFRGRKKSVIVTAAGLNVFPEDLESALRKQPGIRDCVVIPLSQNGNAEPCAVLLADSSNSEAAAHEAIAGANDSLAEYQRIHKWLLWPEPDFPRTPTGKPRISLISTQAKQVLSGKTTTSSTSTNPIAELLSRFANKNNSNASLEQDLQLSSLDRVELMSALEQKFHVELNETSFATAKTTQDIEKLLAQPYSQRTEYSYPHWTQTGFIRWIRLAIYYALVWPATLILGHPKIIGRHNLQSLRGPALIISNHITRRADIGLILASLPVRFRHRLAIAMGGETLLRMRRPPKDWFFVKRFAYQMGYWLVTALFNVFPLPQFSGFRESFRFAAESVDRGYSVLVFPEGEVNNSDTGKMATFQNGIGILAQNLNIPIIPMRLDGVWQMKRQHRRLACINEITVHIGAPLTFVADTSPEEIAQRLQSAVAQL